jgi:hypothetical protein
MKNSACMILMLLVACGCGGGSSNNPISGSNCLSAQTLTGRFIDSPVEGAGYNSYDIRVADAPACHFGTTNADGEFLYEPGHHVLFKLCRACPSIANFPAQAIVTPADIVDASPNIADKQRTFRNLLRFIQTLDVDGDPNNGILLATISTDTYYEAYPGGGSTIMYIDVFDVEESEFETDDAILTIIGRSTNTSNLVDTQSAVAHFDQVIAGLTEYEDPRLNW